VNESNVALGPGEQCVCDLSGAASCRVMLTNQRVIVWAKSSNFDPVRMSSLSLEHIQFASVSRIKNLGCGIAMLSMAWVILIPFSCVLVFLGSFGKRGVDPSTLAIIIVGFVALTLGLIALVVWQSGLREISIGAAGQTLGVQFPHRLASQAEVLAQLIETHRLARIAEITAALNRVAPPVAVLAHRNCPFCNNIVGAQESVCPVCQEPLVCSACHFQRQTSQSRCPQCGHSYGLHA
jgi:hypothetical protein